MNAIKRDLRTTLNANRINAGAKPINSITGFNRITGAKNASEGYKILADLANITKIDRANTTGADIEVILRKIVDKLGNDSLSIRLINNDSAHSSRTVDIPRNSTTMTKNNKLKSTWFHYTYGMEDMYGSGTIYITSGNVKPKVFKQLYLEKTEQYDHCVLSPIFNYATDNLTKSKSESASKRWKSIINKTTKMMETFKAGVPDCEIENICNKLNIRMTLIKNVITKESINYGMKLTRPIKTITYVNNRKDHLHMVITGSKKREEVEDLKPIYDELIKNDEPFTYVERDNCVSAIKTMYNTYNLSNKLNDYYNLLMDEFKLNDCKLSIGSDIENFISYGALTNNSWSSIGNELEQGLNHIDQKKAYYNFRTCDYYEGVPTKMTDFRNCKKIEGLGYYLITKINLSNVSIKNKEILKAINQFQKDGVYTNPELKFADDIGVSYKVVMGAWGKTDRNFQFGVAGLEKHIAQNGETLGSYYALTTGMWLSKSTRTIELTNGDEDYASILADQGIDCKMLSKNVIELSIVKQKPTNLIQVAGYILAYQRIGLIKQMMEFKDFKQIQAIYVDGIFYKGDVEILPTFCSKINTNLHYNFCDVFTARDEVVASAGKERPHYDVELITGEGGCGKTYSSLNDDGFINICYCVPTHRLRASQIEKNNKLQTITWSGMMSENKSTLYGINNSSVLIIDEVSMMTGELQQEIYDKYHETHKLIFIGDVGYQIKAINANVSFDMKLNDHHTHLTKQVRSNDPILLKTLQTMRKCIDDNEAVNFDNFEHITEDQLEEMYNINDMVISFTHKMKNAITDRLRNKHDMKKYYIEKCNNFNNTGDIIIADSPPMNGFERHCFTVHSVQGSTISHPNNLFICDDVLHDNQVAYTAVSRCEKASQIKIVSAYIDEGENDEDLFDLQNEGGY